MKKLLVTFTCTLSVLLTTQAASFKEATKYLDTDGDFIGYVNFEGDGAAIGTQLNAIYTDVVKTIPGMMPIPIDFPTLFDNIGFGCIEAIGMSSKEVEEGLYANRAVTLTQGELTGLFALYGNQSSPTSSFTAAELAPADASGAITGRIHLSALREMTANVLVQVLGPTGKAMVDQQLNKPVPDTDILIGEIIEALSGKWDFFWQETYNENNVANYKLWLQIEGAAELFERLKPLSEKKAIAVVVSQTKNGLFADLTGLGIPGGMGLFIETNREENTVQIFTHRNWGPTSDGPRLSSTEGYKSLAKRLPEKALLYTYTTRTDTTDLLAELKNNPMTAPYADLAEKSLALIIGDFFEPTISAMYFDGDALVSESYAGYSTKQAIMIMPAAVGTGVMAAMAIPAAQKVRNTSQEKAVINNLRQIASAADQYFLEEGKTEVRVEELVGPDKYIRNLTPVAGESYEGMVISTELNEIGVTLEDGRYISIPF